MSINKDILFRNGNEIVTQIKALLIATGAQATGKTARSLDVYADDERLLITGGNSFGLNKREQSFVDGGRAAGGVPPFQAIQEWAIARGLIAGSSRAEDRLVNQIRWSIARRGTKIYRENTPRKHAEEVINEDRIDVIENQISGVYADSILSQIIKTFNN